MKQKLLATLRKGVRVPLTQVDVKIGISRQSPVGRQAKHNVLLRQIDHLRTLFPELEAYYHSSVKADMESCEALLDFYNDLVPLIYEAARETQRRRLLFRLNRHVKDKPYADLIKREIAKSDLRSGVPERASFLLKESHTNGLSAELRNRLQNDIDEFEKQYESRSDLIRSLSIWTGMTGDVRGRTLITYFKQIEQEIRGKRLLHISPETDLEKWFLSEKKRLALSYHTLNPFSEEVDFKQDLTALDLADASFDWVICHRVLEHILDDRAAMREMCRILKPEGKLSISVPQSMQLPVSNEWVVPDHSHHEHVRQYGRDFTDRLRATGFDVQTEYALLKKPLEDHQAHGTYPMRFYTCQKTDAR